MKTSDGVLAQPGLHNVQPASDRLPAAEPDSAVREPGAARAELRRAVARAAAADGT